MVMSMFFFFFSSRRRHTRFKCDWSSDVCSSDLLVERRTVQRTPAFVQQYARRAGIEGTISQAVRTTRLRRTPYQGQHKAHLHHVAIAAGLNLKRISAHLRAQSLGKPTRPVRPKSPFARLQDEEVA